MDAKRNNISSCKLAGQCQKVRVPWWRKLPFLFFLWRCTSGYYVDVQIAARLSLFVSSQKALRQFTNVLAR